MGTHKLTKEDSVKGGQATSRRKTIANRRKTLKYCTLTCDIYPCIYEPLTRKKELKEKGKYLCVVKKLPDDIQRRIFQLLVPTEDNYKSILSELLTELNAEVVKRKNIGSISRMIDYTIKVNETFWGKKLRQDITEKSDQHIKVSWLTKKKLKARK